MAKGPCINELVKQLITAVYLDNKDWQAKQVQKEVHRRLKATNPNTPDNWPALSTIQAILKEVRDNDKLVIERGIDKAWDLSTLDNYPIAAEAIPAVLKVWIYHQDTFMNSLVNRLGLVPFSIREAKWAARFYKVVEDIPSLTQYAFVYAKFEQLRDVSGITRLHTVFCDMLLFSELTKKLPGPEVINNILTRLSGQDEELIKQWAALGLLMSTLLGGNVTQKEYDDIANDPDKLLLYLQHSIKGSRVQPSRGQSR